jgi:hypothetical protein
MKNPITKGEWIQFTLAVFWGFLFWQFCTVPDDPPKVIAWGTLICGVGGSYLSTFAYIWVRYGWRAARSMSINP